MKICWKQVVSRVFEIKREEVTRKWRELYNEKLHNSFIFSARVQRRTTE
jgi:hypothetical protein